MARGMAVQYAKQFRQDVAFLQFDSAVQPLEINTAITVILDLSGGSILSPQFVGFPDGSVMRFYPVMADWDGNTSPVYRWDASGHSFP